MDDLDGGSRLVRRGAALCGGREVGRQSCAPFATVPRERFSGARAVADLHRAGARHSTGRPRAPTRAASTTTSSSACCRRRASTTASRACGPRCSTSSISLPASACCTWAAAPATSAPSWPRSSARRAWRRPSIARRGAGRARRRCARRLALQVTADRGRRRRLARPDAVETSSSPAPASRIPCRTGLDALPPGGQLAAAAHRPAGSGADAARHARAPRPRASRPASPATSASTISRARAIRRPPSGSMHAMRRGDFVTVKSLRREPHAEGRKPAGCTATAGASSRLDPGA